MLDRQVEAVYKRGFGRRLYRVCRVVEGFQAHGLSTSGLEASGCKDFESQGVHAEGQTPGSENPVVWQRTSEK